MRLWGSSYSLEDVAPVRLVAMLGSSTPPGAAGDVIISLVQVPGVLTAKIDGGICKVAVKWQIALKLMALVHILVLQSRILRGESPELRVNRERTKVFSVTGGGGGTALECCWSVNEAEIKCDPVSEAADQLELVLSEAAATELVEALAERIARNGIALRQESGG